jgi:hypothetical protein
MVTNTYPPNTYSSSPSSQVKISAGTAFKAGFFGFFGAAFASFLVSIVVGLALVIIAAIGLAHFNFS